MLQEKTKIAEYVKSLGVKKIVLIVLGIVLVLNILATVTNSRFDSLKAELDQIKTSAAGQLPNDEIAQVKKDLASMQKSVDELKAFTQNLARAEYDAFKAQLEQMNRHLDEMGAMIGKK
ncbi:hypothetical protein HMPREF7215_0276 [Pyramidobacter piscolens W5455]|uniref:Uncharacterized protein n=1 Tax=Pyramidobacter piscolens W5455 TaxID=352165 RepID=A0ABM9ZW69_9BACT|nr:hypothetical protein [Pyramidobacter piscolens]EFB91186.1 hypothetical protein HMPREF7215_0276 [Pyramidobacter piscolens W5455]